MWRSATGSSLGSDEAKSAAGGRGSSKQGVMSSEVNGGRAGEPGTDPGAPLRPHSRLPWVRPARDQRPHPGGLPPTASDSATAEPAITARFATTGGAPFGTLLRIAALAGLVLAAWELGRQLSGGAGAGIGIIAVVVGGVTALAAARAGARAARPLFHAVADRVRADDAEVVAPPAPAKRRHRPDPLIRVAARLNAAVDLSAVLTAVAEEAAAATDARSVAVFLNDRGRDQMVIAESYGLPERIRNLWPTLTPGSFDDLFGGSRVLVVPDIEQDGEVVDRAVYSALGIRGFAMVRMTKNGELVGVLAVLSLDAPREFDDDEVGLLRGIADQATQAVRNAWLLDRADRRLRLTQALRNIDIAIAGSMDLRVTLSVILDEVARQLNVDACDVLLLERRTQFLTFAAGRGFRTTRIEQSRKRIGEGSPGRAALERRAVGVIDLRSQTTEFTRAALIAGEDFHAYYALPLIAKGHVKGVLEIFHRGPLQPDPDWLEFAEALAGQAAIALDNATLFEEMQRLNTSLMMAYDSTLEGWSRALDLRDRETEGHTQRVTELTLRLARASSYTTDELTHVRRGAILHDIGKMGIPDSILLKPGPLTEDEWAVMRRHPVLAHELLSPIPYLGPALDIPYCHHERWDGTGYPRGLRGDQIPLAARIFAVADVWDALRSDRPYRNAWSAPQTREYIRSLAGSHFDPNVVDLFDRVYEA